MQNLPVMLVIRIAALAAHRPLRMFGAAGVRLRILIA
jgi:hypothetical protein